MMVKKYEETIQSEAEEGGDPLVKGCLMKSMGHLLWLKVYELSRLLSCCKRACIIPALLRDTGRV